MSVVKGNIVKGKATGQSGIVLAVTKDGKRARVYIYGPDAEVWKPVLSFTVEVAGLEQCFKCLGSGLFFMGGGTVNGVYTGKTGECYACQGKGKQSDDDRKRCHYYWHRQIEEGVEVESPMEPNPQQPLDEEYVPEASQFNVRQWNEAVKRDDPKPAKVKIRSKSKKKNHPDPERKVIGKPRKPRNRQTDPANPHVTDVDSSPLIDCRGCGTMHREDTMCPW